MAETAIKQFIDMSQFDTITKYVDYFVTNNALPANIKNGWQYVMVLQMWYELGMSPMQAINGITIINGVCTVHWQIAAWMMKSEVDRDVEESTSKICKIKIRRKDAPERIANIEYKIEEAQNAKLLDKDNWVKYPQDMLFYKCLARARKRFCPELLGGIALYEDYQNVEKTASNGQVIDADDQTASPLAQSISECKTVEELEKLKPEIAKANDKELIWIYAKKQQELVKAQTLSSEPITTDDTASETTIVNETVEAEQPTEVASDTTEEWVDRVEQMKEDTDTTNIGE